ncbi:unnamed protein product [Sphagnum balticum]
MTQQLHQKEAAQTQPSPTAELLRGTVERIVFQSKENGFAVFMLAVPAGLVTATGTVPNIAAGQEVQLTGSWKLHKKFGKQFEASSCVPILPTTVNGLKKYLGSGLIKGIGKSYADKLVDHFGENILTIIDERPDRLHEVAGIGPKRVEQIAAAWKDQKEVAAIMIFLQEKGISPTFAVKIYKRYREKAITVLQENPYKLADDIWGISFKTADQIARNLGMHIHAPQRINAGLLFCISETTKQGHLYCTVERLKELAYELLAMQADSYHLVEAALQGLHHQEKIITFTHEGTNYITLPNYYHAEMSCAEKLRFLRDQRSPYQFNQAEIAQLLQKNLSIKLNADQQQGILTCLSNKVTIITGGPGTGKTTLIKQLLQILMDHQVEFKLAAPTGRAAKRITESTGCAATTLHRLLEFDMSVMGFKNHEKNPIKTNFLIVDEASMIDIFLAHALIKAVPLTAHLIFLGDADQLPSVGAGNFFRDCMASGALPVVRLTEIFRQAHDSFIITNAHRINAGEFPVSAPAGTTRDFIFIKEEDPEQLPQHLNRLIFAQLPQYRINPATAMVLTPMNRGPAGTLVLNSVLQGFFNPRATDAITYAGISYKVNDKVMQIRNNYDKAVFNGDIGVLQAINHEDSYFDVVFDERLVRYEFDEINELMLAYAITIHKSQGSEYPAVIIPLFTQHFTLLQRNLVYTAITRAKKLCIIIGQVKALAIAIKNNKSVSRITFLHKFLQ